MVIIGDVSAVSTGGSCRISQIIDIHAHVFPDAVAATAIPRLEAEAAITAFYDGTLLGLLSQMDRAGIDIAVTQPVATKPSQVAKMNDFAASTASDRIVPFGAIHPDTTDPRAEIARMASLGLRGVKLHPEYQAFSPDEPRMEVIYDALAEHDMILLFHAGLDIGLPTDYGRPANFARMIAQNPDLTVILAHMGGWSLWDEVREHLLGMPVYLDTSFASDYMDDEEFLDLVAVHGAERILFGTDGPWADMAAQVQWLRGLPFAEDDLEAILGGNAATLLGL